MCLVRALLGKRLVLPKYILWAFKTNAGGGSHDSRILALLRTVGEEEEGPLAVMPHCNKTPQGTWKGHQSAFYTSPAPLMPPVTSASSACCGLALSSWSQPYINPQPGPPIQACSQKTFWGGPRFLVGELNWIATN